MFRRTNAFFELLYFYKSYWLLLFGCLNVFKCVRSKSCGSLMLLCCWAKLFSYIVFLQRRLFVGLWNIFIVCITNAWNCLVYTLLDYIKNKRFKNILLGLHKYCHTETSFVCQCVMKTSYSMSIQQARFSSRHLLFYARYMNVQKTFKNTLFNIQIQLQNFFNT